MSQDKWHVNTIFVFCNNQQWFLKAYSQPLKEGEEKEMYEMFHTS